MRYLLAIVLPPVAVLVCGKPFQALLNLFLTLLFWVPGMIHALLVANDYYEDRRADRMVQMLAYQGR
ncbi:MAG: YqaE/Pmp3 family membrane protein [Phycisphaeraceae bacterium]|nr:YqaE/Pmp3 family membrane protein [Phycisphaeraceae bacterium]MBX3410490.1 YqaE/Pmp3 family membrane protein [Phycisphaeraceae bacterium]